MSWEADLTALLEADAGVAALVGTRIYHGDARQGTALPYIVFRQLAMTPDQCHDGRDVGDVYLIEIEGIAASAASRNALGRAIDAAVEMKSTSKVSTWLKQDDHADSTEPSSAGGGTAIHRTIQTFTAHAKE